MRDCAIIGDGARCKIIPRLLEGASYSETEEGSLYLIFITSGVSGFLGRGGGGGGIGRKK